MQSRFTVRQLERGDALLSGYRSLRIQLWPDCAGDCDREIEEILSAPDGWAVFVASLDGQKAVGFIEVRLREFAEGAYSSPVAFIEGWFVIVEQRRFGLGSALVKATENWAVSKGCQELGSDTQVNNFLSIQVHERLGFKEVERLVCFLKQLEE